jgi:hypothetical protein
MNDTSPFAADMPLPAPRSRLWSTWFGRRRSLEPFIESIPFEAVRQSMPSVEEAAHFGEAILLEDHISVLHRDGTITYGVHYISMLHGDMNLAGWEQAAWYYHPKAWRPTVHHACVRFAEGGSQQAQVYDRVIDPTTKLRMTQVVFGPLRRGVIAEIAYQMDHFQPQPQGPCNWGQFFLQTAAPCRRRRYTVAVAAPFQAHVQVHQGAESPTEREVDDYRVYQWERRNVPGVEWDLWTPALRDFGPWVDFTTLPSWAPVAKQYRQDMGPTRSREVETLARQLTRGAGSDRQKVSAIYGYAADQVRYGRPPHEVYLPASRSVNKVFEDLRGDCKDKSTLMVSLLQAVDIDADVAVVMTRAQGCGRFLPGPRFNHAVVVAKVDDQMLWLDAAAGPFTFGELPFQDQGIWALILGDGAHTYLETPAPRPEDHGVEWVGQGRLDEAGAYDFSLQFSARGERASLLRLSLLHRNRDFRDRTLRFTLARGMPGAVVTDLRTTGIEEVTAPLRCDCRVQLPGCGQRHDNIWMVRIPWAEPVIFDGPLAADNRPQPLAAPLIQETRERHEVELPGPLSPGLLVESREECPWARYENTSRVEGSRLICERRLIMLGGVAPAERFAEFRKFWAACARADAAPVVLVSQESVITDH